MVFAVFDPSPLTMCIYKLQFLAFISKLARYALMWDNNIFTNQLDQFCQYQEIVHNFQADNYSSRSAIANE